MIDPTQPPSGKPAPDRPSRDRGQTVQDFAIGIGLFMLAVAFVFAFIPTVITPFGDAGGAETAQADRIAATIIDGAEVGPPNYLDENATRSFNGENETALASEFGLQTAGAGINITVSTLDDSGQQSYVYASEAKYDGQAGASATRIVTTKDSECDPACKLTVRVWSS